MNPFRGLNFDSKIRQNGACSGAMYTTRQNQAVAFHEWGATKYLCWNQEAGRNDCKVC